MGFFFRQLDRNEAVAADFTQDAFMRIWTARNKFVGTNFRTWLFTIAFNLVKNHYRHAEHQQHYEQFLALHQAVTEDSNVVETLDGEAFDRALKQELERMSPDALLLFSLRFEEELSVPQIAEVMAIPEGTVKSRLHTLTQTLLLGLGCHTGSSSCRHCPRYVSELDCEQRLTRPICSDHRHRRSGPSGSRHPISHASSRKGTNRGTSGLYS